MIDFPPSETHDLGEPERSELHGCFAELTRILVLPAVWNGRDARSIMESFCVAIESALELEACYVCSRPEPAEPITCVLRLRGGFVSADHPAWRCLTHAAGRTHGGPPGVIDDTPLGSLRTVSYDMGCFGEGSVCVGSTRAGFPTPGEAVLLQTAVTLFGSALQTAQLKREQENAHRANEELIATLGHELRNPLSPIVTALNLLKLRSGDALSREYEIIARQVARLTRVIDDLQDMSRLSRGRIELSRAPVEIASVVEQALRASGALLEQRRHYVRVEVPSSGLVVDGDAVRLVQVTTNLITNAAKCTEPGGNIAVRAWREAETVRLSVKDSGAGIDARLLPKIFDLFPGGGQAAVRVPGGLGVGLPLVKALVALHGGSVVAESAGPGRGSEFIVTLPAHSPASHAASGARVSAAVPRPTTSERVLVVDDNRDAAELVGEMLAAVGHEVSVAHDALQALSLIARIKPSVVVLDIGLPVMDGYELASRIRDEFGPHVPRLVAVTGYGLEEDKARSREVGIQTHLVKPVDVDKLIAAVSAETVSP